MSVHRIDPDDVATRVVGVLGLNTDFIDLFSPEGLCASLRRAASFLCPASPQQLVDAVNDALAPLNPGLEREEVADALDTLIGVGDLLELRIPGSRMRLLFLGPPSYVEKHPGHFLLLGVRPFAGQLVDEESLGSAVTYEAHTRTVVLESDGAVEALAAAGLHRMTREQWARAPREEFAATILEQARASLSSALGAGHIAGLTVIDSSASVRYYKGRWREPLSTDNGMFIGRRPQTYGAPIWCLVDFTKGVPNAVLDLPIDELATPGWDDGRRLQAALDAHRGSPQEFRVQQTGDTGSDWIFDFFGPLPSWAERYLDLTGLPVSRQRGALFSYRISDGAERETCAFLSNALWMRATEEGQAR